MDYIEIYYQDVLKKVKNKINLLKLNQTKFSITLDEWSGLNNRRYMNINIHWGSSNKICLGLQEIKGSFTSENAYKLIKHFLNNLELIGRRISYHLRQMVLLSCANYKNSQVIFNRNVIIMLSISQLTKHFIKMILK